VPPPSRRSSPSLFSLNPEDVITITRKHDGRRGSLIAMLEDVQALYNYLPRDALKIVAKQTGQSLVDIYGIATFYKAFSLEPRGRHLVSVCVGTACHVRGAPTILDEFEKLLDVRAGQTTPDRMFSLQTVNCLGACALGPVVVVDGEYHRNVTVAGVRGIIERRYRSADEQAVYQDERIFRVDVACPVCNRSLLTNEHMMGGEPMVHVTVSFGRKHGWLRLSSLYGDYRIQSEHEIPPETIVDFFCPKCHAELRSPKLCARCDAEMIPLFVRGGGVIQLCSRRGCKEHMLDLGD